MAALWFWHFPGPYQAALNSERIHALEHTSFLVTAILLWWVILQPTGHRRLSHAAAIPYLVATMAQSGALGALLMLSPFPWYPAHAQGTQLWGSTLLADQQRAGLIMWIPAALAYVTAAVWLFVRWMADDERATARADALRLATRVAPLIVVTVLVTVSCADAAAHEPDHFVTGGSVARGQIAIQRYGCGSCHMIPGIRDAGGMVGPPLIHWSQRRIIAGEVPNDPEHLVTWITMPQAVEPGTAMPNMGVSDGEARDMAAYLYSIK